MIEKERRAAAMLAMQHMQDLIKQKRCPRCEEPIQKYEQVGHCVYGEPCGHRQWQGTVPA